MMKQQGGVPDASKRTPQFSMIDRRVAYIETEAQPKGDKRFMRILWTNSNNKLDTMIQFVGMDELSVPLVTRNSKNNTRPRNPLAPGLLRDMEQSPLKARALNEQMTRAAGPQLVNQQLGTPRNDQQIRQLQYLHRKRSITEDQYLRLFKLSCEYPTMRLFTLAPRFLLVSTYLFILYIFINFILILIFILFILVLLVIMLVILLYILLFAILLLVILLVILLASSSSSSSSSSLSYHCFSGPGQA